VRTREEETGAGFKYYDLKPYFTNPLLKLVVDNTHGNLQAKL
jgi:hypothetical protein